MTQTERLVEFIDQHGAVTSPEAFSRLGITQLGRCVDDLEKQGYEFARKRVAGTRLKAYSITKKPDLKLF